MQLLNLIKKYFTSYSRNIFEKGLKKLRKKDFKGALEVFDELAEIEPMYEVFHNRGSIYFKMNNYENAILDYTKAIQLDPNLPEAYLGLGIVYTRLGQYEKAEYHYSKVIQVEPANENAYTNRGFARMKLQNFSGALEDFNQSLRLNPKNGLVYANRGSLYYQIDKLAEARQDWEKAGKFGVREAIEMLVQHC